MHARSVQPSAATSLALSLALAGASIFSGCSSQHSLEEHVSGHATAIRDTATLRTFRVDEPVELATSGAIGVVVESFGGDVSVRADPRVKQTRVEVRRASNMGLGRWDESRQELDDIAWTATLEPRETGGDTLKVAVTTQNPEAHYFRADVVIVAPALDAVAVRTRRGSVSVVENQGPVDIETTSGDVRMLTPWPMTQPIKIITSDGAIDFRVRGESRLSFDAETRGGEVRQRCLFGKWRALGSGNDHDRMLATLNDGTNPVFLRTSDKNIRIAVVADPTNVGREIVDP